MVSIGVRAGQLGGTDACSRPAWYLTHEYADPDHLDQAGREPVPAGHSRRPAADRRGQDQGRGEPGRQVPAPQLRPQALSGGIALGYKQLLEVERGWRDLKQVIDLRPACHRKEERIRAHVSLCWLALLLIRIAETTTSVTWARIAGKLDLLTLGTFTGPAGTFRQSAELTKTQRDLLASSSSSRRRKIIEATPAAAP